VKNKLNTEFREDAEFRGGGKETETIQL